MSDEVDDAGADAGDDDSLGDELDAESADELVCAEFELDSEDDDEEPDDDVEELESGSADAMPGMVATAIPIPTATAKAPTRPICLAIPIAVASAQPICATRHMVGRGRRDELSNRLLGFLPRPTRHLPSDRLEG